MARPTKYNAEMQAKAEKYLLGNVHEWVDKDGRDREDITYGDHRSVIPSAEGLARFLGVATSTLYLWGEKHSEFSETLAEVQEDQKNITLNEGLKNNFNATIAKLVLANHGMHDKQDTTNTMNVTLESDSTKL